MKIKKIGKLAVVLAASTALVATLINDKKNKENTEALKRERLKSHDLEDQLELLRGEIYQQDIKYRI